MLSNVFFSIKLNMFIGNIRGAVAQAVACLTTVQGVRTHINFDPARPGQTVFRR